MSQRCPKVHEGTGEQCTRDAGHEAEGLRCQLPPAHRCHARGCVRVVPPRMLMCTAHWKMVPRELQREVWRQYRDGQERRKDPTGAYLDAANAAIDAVAKLEAERAAKAAAPKHQLDMFGGGTTTVAGDDGRAHSASPITPSRTERST